MYTKWYFDIIIQLFLHLKTWFKDIFSRNGASCWPWQPRPVAKSTTSRVTWGECHWKISSTLVGCRDFMVGFFGSRHLKRMRRIQLKIWNTPSWKWKLNRDPLIFSCNAHGKSQLEGWALACWLAVLLVCTEAKFDQLISVLRSRQKTSAAHVDRVTGLPSHFPHEGLLPYNPGPMCSLVLFNVVWKGVFLLGAAEFGNCYLRISPTAWPVGGMIWI